MVPNISLNCQSWYFRLNFPKNGIFLYENRKSKHHWILHIRISLGTRLQLKLAIFNFGPNLTKRVFVIKNRKKREYYHWILHIPYGLGTKFQPNLAMLIFCTKFSHKGYFWWKTEKVNITIKFFIFELV